MLLPFEIRGYVVIQISKQAIITHFQILGKKNNGCHNDRGRMHNPGVNIREVFLEKLAGRLRLI